ncbi:MAG: alpha/beta fold hydrolase [Spirochaetota bacterium]
MDTKHQLVQKTYSIAAIDGTPLKVYRSHKEIRFAAPILMTHGACSNAGVCSLLARYLVNHGLDVWVFEWRGHGQSPKLYANPDFDTVAKNDLVPVIETVVSESKKQNFFWVSHSGGGLKFLMALGLYPEYQKYVKGYITLASQATEGFRSSFSSQMVILQGLLVNTILPSFPGKLLKIGPENEYGALMQQWFFWNIRKRWDSKEGFDYLQALKQMIFPCLFLSSSKDTVAPSSGVAALYEKVASIDKNHIICGKEQGFENDFSHASVFTSKQAHKEIYPILFQWLQERDSS